MIAFGVDSDVFNMKLLFKIRPKGSSVLKGCGSTLYVLSVLVSPVEALDARFVSHRTHILMLERACLWVSNLNNQVVYDLEARDRSLWPLFVPKYRLNIKGEVQGRISQPLDPKSPFPTLALPRGHEVLFELGFPKR